MTQHQKWTYTRNPENTRWIIDSEPSHAIACTAGYGSDDESVARLIAAAPELLEAAQMGVSWLTAALNCTLWVWDGDQREAAEVELAKMNAAIAKAVQS